MAGAETPRVFTDQQSPQQRPDAPQVDQTRKPEQNEGTNIAEQIDAAMDKGNLDLGKLRKGEKVTVNYDYTMRQLGAPEIGISLSGEEGFKEKSDRMAEKAKEVLSSGYFEADGKVYQAEVGKYVNPQLVPSRATNSIELRGLTFGVDLKAADGSVNHISLKVTESSATGLENYTPASKEEFEKSKASASQSRMKEQSRSAVAASERSDPSTSSAEVGLESGLGQLQPDEVRFAENPNKDLPKPKPASPSNKLRSMVASMFPGLDRYSKGQ
jgi:hypothetical protein